MACANAVARCRHGRARRPRGHATGRSSFSTSSRSCWAWPRPCTTARRARSCRRSSARRTSTARTACSRSRRPSGRPSSARRSARHCSRWRRLPLFLNASGFALAALLLLAPARIVPPAARPQHRPRSAHDIADGVRWLRRHQFLRGLTLISAGTASRRTSPTACSSCTCSRCCTCRRATSAWCCSSPESVDCSAALRTTRWRGGSGAARCSSRAPSSAALLRSRWASRANGFVGAALFAVSAFGVMLWNVITMSLRQALIPHAPVRTGAGRLPHGGVGAIPLGALPGGALAHAFGIPTVFVIAGVALLADGRAGSCASSHRAPRPVHRRRTSCRRSAEAVLAHRRGGLAPGAPTRTDDPRRRRSAASHWGSVTRSVRCWRIRASGPRCRR